MAELSLLPPVVRLPSGDVVHVDLCNWERVRAMRLHRSTAGGKVYCVTHLGRGRRRRTISLHRLLMAAQAGQEVDHRNGVGLDCRYSNMRLCSHRENARNQGSHGGTSRFVGVCWDRARGRWVAYVAGRFVGRFGSEVEAARARDGAAVRLFGSYARLNLGGRVDALG